MRCKPRTRVCMRGGCQERRGGGEGCSSGGRREKGREGVEEDLRALDGGELQVVDGRRENEKETHQAQARPALRVRDQVLDGPVLSRSRSSLLRRESP